jgi:O-antigen/teichoic acid export membrane protein
MFTAISQPLVNRFARLRRAGLQHDMRSTFLKLLGLVTGCSIAGILFVAVGGRWMLATIFGNQFATADKLLLLIAISLAANLLAILPQSLLHARRQYRTFLLREMISVFVCLALLLILVPAWGLIGAGYSIVGASVFRLAFLAIGLSFGARISGSETLDPLGLVVGGAS